MDAKMEVKVNIHNAKPEAWMGGTTIGLSFRGENVNITAFLEAEAALKVGEELVKIGQKAKAMKDLINS